MSKEQELDLAKVIREKIELAGQRGQKEQYHVDGEYGDHGWMHYLKGIRDACWAVDEVITELKEKYPCEECQEGNCEECMSDCFEPWDVLWKAPDGTFKGRCDNCGFVHVFIEGHVTQYKFCPQCGEQKQDL